MEEVFKFYFEREGSPGDIAGLAAAAAAAGVDEAAAAAYLATSEGEADVIHEAAELQRRYRITGVPFFIIGDRIGISGAQDPATFVEALEEAATDVPAGTGASGAPEVGKGGGGGATTAAAAATGGMGGLR